MLPDSAGIETVRSISSINPYLAIVVLIGSDDDETVEVDIVRYSGESVIAEMQVVETDWDNKSVYLVLFHDCLIPA
jgi:hypothetical protein